MTGAGGGGAKGGATGGTVGGAEGGTEARALNGAGPPAAAAVGDEKDGIALGAGPAVLPRRVGPAHSPSTGGGGTGGADGPVTPLEPA